MNKTELLKDLSTVIEKDKKNNNLIFFRDNDELKYLEEWIKNDQRPLQEILHSEISLKKLLASCNKCTGVENKKIGFGSGDNGVMIILNSPMLIGKVEKDVFKTESIDLLKKMVTSIGCDFKECYTTNLIKCDITDEFIRPSQVARECKTILDKEIEIIAPKVILLMGDIIQLQSIIKSSHGISALPPMIPWPLPDYGSIGLPKKVMR